MRIAVKKKTFPRKFRTLYFNLLIFQNAFPGLKSIPGISRTFKDFPGISHPVNI